MTSLMPVLPVYIKLYSIQHLPSIASPEYRASLKAIIQRHRPALNLSFEEFYYPTQFHQF